MSNEQGNDEPQSSQAETAAQPKYVTEEQLNRAITQRLKSFEKSIASSLEESSKAMLSKLEEMRPPPQASSQPEKAADESPIVKGLQKQIADLQAKQKAADEAVQAARMAQRDQALRTKLAEELGRYGVDSGRVKHAVGYLVDAAKAVSYDEGSDEIVFKDKNDVVDLSTGLKSWLSTDDGKIYVPPRGAQGSGDRKVSNTRAAAPKKDGVSYADIGNWILGQTGGGENQ